MSVLAMLDGAPGILGALGGFPLLILFVGAMYFLMIAPQQKKQKQWQATLSQIKVGDRVTTAGGMRGTIVMLKDDAIILKIQPDNLKVEVVKSAIATVDTGDAPKS